jgi:hypothetical protein
VAYAARRNELPVQRREVLAKSAEPALRKSLPQLVESSGPLAALDHLAELQGVTPIRPRHRLSGAAQGFGIASLACIFVWWIPFAGAGLGFIFAVLAIAFGMNAVKAIRAEPGKLQGEEQAKRGRVLGIIGLILNLLALGFFVFAFTVGFPSA